MKSQITALVVEFVCPHIIRGCIGCTVVAQLTPFLPVFGSNL